MHDPFISITNVPYTRSSMRRDTLISLRNSMPETQNLEERAKALYEILRKRLRYQKTDNKTAEEVYQQGFGVCSDMTEVYITAASFCGIPAEYVSVTRDYKGKKVNHACARIHTPRNILVDLAYNKFDVHHKEYQSEGCEYVMPGEKRKVNPLKYLTLGICLTEIIEHYETMIKWVEKII